MEWELPKQKRRVRSGRVSQVSQEQPTGARAQFRQANSKQTVSKHAERLTPQVAPEDRMRKQKRPQPSTRVARIPLTLADVMLFKQTRVQSSQVPDNGTQVEPTALATVRAAGITGNKSGNFVSEASRSRATRIAERREGKPKKRCSRLKRIILRERVAKALELADKDIELARGAVAQATVLRSTLMDQLKEAERHLQNSSKGAVATNWHVQVEVLRLAVEQAEAGLQEHISALAIAEQTRQDKLKQKEQFLKEQSSILDQSSNSSSTSASLATSSADVCTKRQSSSIGNFEPSITVSQPVAGNLLGKPMDAAAQEQHVLHSPGTSTSANLNPHPTHGPEQRCSSSAVNVEIASNATNGSTTSQSLHEHVAAVSHNQLGLSWLSDVSSDSDDSDCSDSGSDSPDNTVNVLSSWLNAAGIQKYEKSVRRAQREGRSDTNTASSYVAATATPTLVGALTLEKCTINDTSFQAQAVFEEPGTASAHTACTASTGSIVQHRSSIQQPNASEIVNDRKSLDHSKPGGSPPVTNTDAQSLNKAHVVSPSSTPLETTASAVLSRSSSPPNGESERTAGVPSCPTISPHAPPAVMRPSPRQLSALSHMAPEWTPRQPTTTHTLQDGTQGSSVAGAQLSSNTMLTQPDAAASPLHCPAHNSSLTHQHAQAVSTGHPGWRGSDPGPVATQQDAAITGTASSWHASAEMSVAVGEHQGGGQEGGSAPGTCNMQLQPSACVTEYTCAMCNVVCSSLDNLDQHVAGKKHLRKVQLAAASRVTIPPLAKDSRDQHRSTYVGVDSDRREYCTQVIDTELNSTVIKLLGNLHKWQERAKALQPTKAHKAKRLVMGLRESAKYMKINKVRTLIVAPNIESNGPEGGLDAEIKTLVDNANNNNIPVVFALSRRKLGQVFAANRTASVVAILDCSGADEEYHQLHRLAQQGRDQWRQHSAGQSEPAVAA